MLGFLALLGALWTAPFCESGLCSCVGPRSVAESRDAASAVFTGTAVSVRDTVIGRGTARGAMRMRRVVLRVDRAWKGVESRTVTVLTTPSDASCGFPFERGEAYVVYASRSVDGPLMTGLCGRTALLSRAGEDVGALGPPARRWR